MMRFSVIRNINFGYCRCRLRCRSTSLSSFISVLTTTRSITCGKRLIRLSKRMGELDMFSRREADRLIFDGRVLVDGILAEVGRKVGSDLRADRIEIIHSNNVNNNVNKNNNNKIIHSLVLHKPKGFVSGQPEHDHPPAIRLLTSKNRIILEEEKGELNDESSHYNEQDNNRHSYNWTRFACAGRLDMDSTGLLIFTKHGVLAKKLIGSSSYIEKEYIVEVQAATNVTKREYAIDPNFVLPSSNERRLFDLTHILRGGETLLGDTRPLKPCPHIRWIVKGERLLITLTEGRKHHIRRLCRELLGWHVVGLKRIRIGPIQLQSDEQQVKANVEENTYVLPEGYWRPLSQNEVEVILAIPTN